MWVSAEEKENIVVQKKNNSCAESSWYDLFSSYCALAAEHRWDTSTELWNIMMEDGMWGGGG